MMAGDEAVNIASEVEEGAPPTTEAAKGIKAIDKTTVHRICSGQVVLTLAVAVKELVENSLDAGATSVDVRLKEHGAALLEVADNGKGVEEHDFEGLTLKHHTSKIQDFGDVVGVKTFGFRGEALSSLCALSDLTVTTRHATSHVASKLTYNHNGILTSKTATSRQVGTTVSLQSLFSTLPVRHKEFVRNIKREFNKMVQVLYSYCLISTGVRITCTNQSEKGKKTVVVSTTGHPTIRENLSSIFGAKQAASLLEFQQETASQEVLEEYGIVEAAAEAAAPQFSLEGLVSTCAHGQGRSSSDRQFYFINARPCDPIKVMKVVNEVFHQYNRHQFPCVVLNIRLREADVDINVTPDKRQIMVSREKLLLATIKTSLTQLYEHIPNTYCLQNTSLTPSHKSLTSPSPSPSPRPSPSPQTPTSTVSKVSALTQRFGRHSSGTPQPSTPVSGLKRSLSLSGMVTPSPERKQPKMMQFFQQAATPEATTTTTTTTHSPDLTSNGVDPSPSPAAEEGEEGRTQGDTEMNTEAAESGSKLNGDDDDTANDGEEVHSAGHGRNGDVDSSDTRSNGTINPDSEINGEKSSDVGNGEKDNDPSENIAGGKTRASPSSFSSTLSSFSHSSAKGPSAREGSSVKVTPAPTPSAKCNKIHSATNDFLSNLKAKRCLISSTRPTSERKRTPEEGRGDAAENGFEELEVLYEGRGGGDEKAVMMQNSEEEVRRDTEEPEVLRKVIVCEEYDTKGLTEQRRCKNVPFNMASLRRRLRQRTRKEEKKEEERRQLVRRFRAKISPTDNTAAEDELQKEISKDMFGKMEILGQFNLGFIITRLNQDLFIIDQHATDEKYNFETLQQTCILRNQRLIAPQTLELTAVGEATLLDNLEIFHKNGFEFLVKEDEPAGRRVRLVSMPVSRGWEFGRSDVEELIFMLSDAPGVMCRPSRVRAMFASRSCRKSVMIGTALSHRQMRTLVTHMGEIEQPWNCPHGRPTMRHLVNLDLVVPIQCQE